MIDTKGRELHEMLMQRILYEEGDRTISAPVLEAMESYDIHMNKLNKTEGIIYNKKGEALMEMYGVDDEYE